MVCPEPWEGGAPFCEGAGDVSPPVELGVFPVEEPGEWDSGDAGDVLVEFEGVPDVPEVTDEVRSCSSAFLSTLSAASRRDATTCWILGLRSVCQFWRKASASVQLGEQEYY